MSLSNSFFYMPSWPHSSGPATTSQRSVSSQVRSLSPSSRMPVTKSVSHSKSTPQLSKMAAMLSGSSPSPPPLLRAESDLNTLPDPRAPTPNLARHSSSDSTQHPDLSNEVATLSTKLINAINHQTTLDDALQATRQELQAARERLAQLEASNRDYEERVSKGLLVTKETYDKMQRSLQDELAEERKQKLTVEKEKRRIESELENLTTALFEEANTMVAAARRETEASERRNESLRNQLKDTEGLLASQQEQLHDLKIVMQQMSSDREDNDTSTQLSTAPSTPAIPSNDKMSRIFESSNPTPLASGGEEFQPDHPLHYSHLIRPILRADGPAYKEFQELLRTGRASAPSSRAASGNFSGLNVLGISALNGSSTSLPSSSPIIGSSTTISSSPREPANAGNALKDNKFYKRALVEDIEPTLRLDLAPGISWLARRSVISSMTAGTLVVEPHPPVSKFYGPVYPCAMCGENRKGDQYGRKHRFRVSESDDAQRYPLCDPCLGRLRATCDYVGFLRMVRDGHWRAETEDEQRNSWEESVRLRERMFWARVGGGVVPAFMQPKECPRSPSFSAHKVSEEVNDDTAQTCSVIPEVNLEASSPQKEQGPFHSKEMEKRGSNGEDVLEAEPSVKPPACDDSEQREAEERRIQEMSEQHQEERLGAPDRTPRLDDASSIYSNPHDESPPPLSPPKKERLSIAIPGSFD